MLGTTSMLQVMRGTNSNRQKNTYTMAPHNSSDYQLLQMKIQIQGVGGWESPAAGSACADTMYIMIQTVCLNKHKARKKLHHIFSVKSVLYKIKNKCRKMSVLFF